MKRGETTTNFRHHSPLDQIWFGICLDKQPALPLLRTSRGPPLDVP